MNSKAFLKSVGLIFSSSVLSQIVNIFSVFLLVGYLNSEGFGEYSVFLAYSTIFVSINLLSFDKTLPNIADDELVNFLIGIIGVLLLYSLVSLIILAIIGYEYLHYVTIYIVIAAFMKIIQMLAIREKNFGVINYSRLIPAIFFLVSIVACNELDVLNLETTIIIYCTSFTIAIFYSLYALKGVGRNSQKFSINRACALLNEEKEFALYTAPSEIFNRLAFYLPTLIIDSFFGAVMAGQYSLMLRVCFAPISLITMAVGQVLQSHLAHLNRQSKEKLFLLSKTNVLKILTLSIFVSLGFFLIIPELVLFIFGDEWNTAYQFIKIMSPAFGIMAVVTPLAIGFHVYRMNLENLKQQGIYLLISIFSFGIAVFVDNIVLGIYIFSILSLFRYLYMLKVLSRIL